MKQAGHALGGLNRSRILGEGDDGGAGGREVQRERVRVGLAGDETKRVAVKRQDPAEVAGDEGDVAEDEGGAGGHAQRLHRF